MVGTFVLTILLAGEPILTFDYIKDSTACTDTGKAIVEIVSKNLDSLLKGREVSWKCDPSQERSELDGLEPLVHTNTQVPQA